MHRRYNRWWSRFDQPDPYDGSYSLSNPQSFNRYAYVGNDPVNFTDPSGLDWQDDLGPPPPLPGGPTGSVDIPISFDDPFDDPFFRGFGRDLPMIMPVVSERPMIPLIPIPQNPDPVQNQPCPPSGQQLANDPVVQRELNRAWRDSRPGQSNRREQGGWIYARNGRISIIRARPGTTYSMTLHNPPQPPGALLVGNFHTHPTLSSQSGDPNQSDGDLQSEVFRGLPGLLRNENGITPYGPNRRGSNPELALYPGGPDKWLSGAPREFDELSTLERT